MLFMVFNFFIFFISLGNLKRERMLSTNVILKSNSEKCDVQHKRKGVDAVQSDDDDKQLQGVCVNFNQF